MAKFLTKAREILGINARNLLYLSRYNSRANKKFADDKIFTKQFLESRGVGVAKLFHVVRQHTQLTSDFFNDLPDSFVVKPNRGFAGGGILVITKKKGRSWLTSTGRRISRDVLYRHCIEILDGKYSISGVYDTVIFEERLIPHPDFRKLTEFGLPDVRVIVFNLVPVMAMIRVPTFESEGKANMELGALAMGIDIGSGRTTGAALFSKFLKKLPNGESAVGFQIPFWDEILQAAAKIQNVTKIGYLGADFAITKTGVKVLELNARAGLKIQVANRTPLKRRLNKVLDLKVLTPEDGVEIAKTLFSEKSGNEEEFAKKPVIGMLEPVILNTEEPQTVIAKIDLSAEENVVPDRFREGKSSILDVTVAGQRLKLSFKWGDIEGADILLAGKFLGDFYIDPNKKVDRLSEVLTSDVEERKIRNVDEKLCEIDEQIKLLSYINPSNLTEQKELFLSHQEFSPRFWYREPKLDLQQLRRDLKRIPKVDHSLFPLFLRKIQELEARISLIESVGTSDFQAFSEKVFGKVSPATYQAAVAFLKKHENPPSDDSPELDVGLAVGRVKEFLEKYKLSHWKIKIIEESVVDMQVTKKGFILVRKGAVFTENRLQALLAHEIGTHVFRFENGRLQPFRIFERGTAGYLQTEEGLAVYNQNALGLDFGEKFLTPALLVVSIFMAKKMGFCDLFQFLKTTYPISDDLAWKLCIKAKRGFENTDTPGAFMKDSVYFRGHANVMKFLEKGGTIEQLYIGKIAIDDLKILKDFEGLVEPKFLL